MNKFYTLSMGAAMLLASISTADAQSRKTWDFTKGFSDETKANLNADANWVANRKNSETEEVTGWKDNTKMSGTLTANGEVISELEGLVFGTAGLSSSNNYLLDPASIRLSRAGMIINLPKLANGQQVTVEAKSANSDTSRGVTANTDVLVKEAGPDGDIAPGSEGHQTWVWRVSTDSEDSVAVSIKVLVGGVDFYLIQIDNGDEGDMDEVTKVAYLYDGSDNGNGSIPYDLNGDGILDDNDFDSDYVYNYTAIGEKETTRIDIGKYDATEKTLADSLETFGVVVYSPYLRATSPNVDLLYSEINRIPVLNLNPYLYEAWGQGSAVVPAKHTSIYTLTEESAEHVLFEGCGVTGTEYEFYQDGNPDEDNFYADKVLGYQLTAGSDFEDDEVLAYVDDAPAIHLHGTKNTYMLLPFSGRSCTDGEFVLETQIFANALDYLADTKSKVLNASKPSVTYKYEDQQTTATLTSGITGARIYYTLDGTEPTTASTRYTEPLVFGASQNGTVLNAFVTAPAYNASNVLSDTVVVKSKLAQPTYSINVENGVANVTLASAEGADVYYNITGSTDATKSSLFVDTLGLVVKRPTILTAFAYAEDKLASDRLDFVVDLADLVYYNDTILHENFQGSEWNAGTNLATQANYYSDEIADMTVTPNEEGLNDTTYTYVPANELQEVIVNDTWKTQSYGQRILVQKTGTSDVIMNSYGPATAFDAGATGTAISFLQAGKSGDPATAELISRTTFAAPFAVGLHFTGQAESGNGKLDGTYCETVVVSVSKDSVEWSVVDTLSTNYMKLMSFQTAEVAGDGQYYIKVASANPAKYSNKQKTMIFDLWVLGASAERPTTGIIEVVANQSAKTVQVVQMYNLAGQQIRVAEQGVNIIRTVYSDGSVSARKIFVK